jgi:hypothetical protein
MSFSPLLRAPHLTLPVALAPRLSLSLHVDLPPVRCSPLLVSFGILHHLPVELRGSAAMSRFSLPRIHPFVFFSPCLCVFLLYHSLSLGLMGVQIRDAACLVGSPA